MTIKLKEAKWLDLLSDKVDKEKILSMRESHIDTLNDPRWNDYK